MNPEVVTYWILFFYCVVCGLAVGSFLNVVIYRLPQGQNIAVPGSHCPRCQTPIWAIDNIPILSYLWLRGRCRHCDVAIHWRYPLVEAVNGLLWALIFLAQGPTPHAVVYMIIASGALAGGLIDYEHMILPDPINFGGMALGIAAAIAGWLPLSLPESLLGGLFGYLFLYVVYKGSLIVYGREGLGYGDVKYLAMVGFVLGWELSLMVVLLGALTGAMVMSALIAMGIHKREDYFAFGPFLVPPTFVAMIFGDGLVNWYFAFTPGLL